jgi:DNA-binding MarR family transcriptional regulator
MSPTRQAPTHVPPVTLGAAAIDPTDRIGKVGLAWRELRRGASMQALRERIYQGDVGLIDMGLADALEVLVLAGPCRMRELADGLRVDPSTATRTVDRLVQQGYAARVPDPDDARAVLVAATAAGEAVRVRVRDQARLALDEILDEFTDDEADQLAELMSRLVASVDRYIVGSGQNSSDR